MKHQCPPITQDLLKALPDVVPTAVLDRVAGFMQQVNTSTHELCSSPLAMPVLKCCSHPLPTPYFSSSFFSTIPCHPHPCLRARRRPCPRPHLRCITRSQKQRDR
jgi:hypothetical protein